MSAPRVQIFVDSYGAEDIPSLVWFCTGTGWESCGEGEAFTIAEAADAGRKHLREVHAPTVGTYCRAHGCHKDICGCGCSHTPKPDESGSDFVPTISAACSGGDARTQIHICTKCGLVSTCNRQPNGARA